MEVHSMSYMINSMTGPDLVSSESHSTSFPCLENFPGMNEISMHKEGWTEGGREGRNGFWEISAVAALTT